MRIFKTFNLLQKQFGKKYKTMGVNTVNATQVTINVTDSIPPENIATIDKGSLVGNTKSKEQLQTWQDAIEEQIEKISTYAVKGEATPTSSPTPYNPTDYPKGLFEKWEVKSVGVYTNFKDGSTPPQSIEITAEDLNKKLAYINVTNGVSKKDTIDIPGVVAKTDYDKNDNTNAATMKSADEHFNFKSKSFNYALDLSENTFGKYTEIIGTVTFSEGTGSVFGKIAYVKLTGGTVVFPSGFVAQIGTADYDPTKTNVIAFWKEYDKVRYFNEVFTLEPLPMDGLISYYNFNGKTPNALLSSIAPNFGTPFTGNTSGFRINSSGGWLQQINNASSVNSAIAIDVGNVTHYKATLYVSLSQELEVNIGTTAYNVWSDYINIQFMSTSRIQHVSPSVPTGEIIYSSSTIEYPNTRFYKWEFVVNGNSVTVFYEGNQLVTYTHGNTGSLFSVIFKNANDNFQSIKIEEL